MGIDHFVIEKFEIINFYPQSIIFSSEYYTLIFIENGTIETNLKKKFLKSNDIIILEPFDDVYLCNTCDLNAILYVLRFKAIEAKKYIDLWNINREEPFIDASSVRKNIKECFEDVLYNSADEKIKNTIYTKNFLYLTELIYSLTNDEKSHTSKQLNKYTSLVLEYLNLNFCFADISLKLIANYIHVDVKHLSKIIKNDLNTTFTELLTEKRIKTAQKLLAKYDTSITQIAFDVGYTDPFYFSRIFKSKTGVSPSEYRIKLKQRAQIIKKE